MKGFLRLGNNNFDGDFTGQPPIIPTEEKNVLVIGTQVLVFGNNSNVLTIE
jgi:hypothetical protein